MNLPHRDTSFEGVAIRYWEAGQGQPLLMLHGSGPGASSHGNWRLAINELAHDFHVIAGDLIGFGESGRKPEPPYFDYELWVRQAGYLLGLFQSDAVNVIGHSLSGAIALRLAGSDRRVRRVLTTATLGSRMKINEAGIEVWTFPKDRAALIHAGQTLVYNPALIDEAYVAGRTKILFDGDYEAYFSQMFGGDKQAYIDAAVLSEAQLKAITCDVLLVHGRNDTPTPIESSYEIARAIPQADVVSLARCGHSVALEHPRKLAGLARYFFG